MALKKVDIYPRWIHYLPFFLICMQLTQTIYSKDDRSVSVNGIFNLCAFYRMYSIKHSGSTAGWSWTPRGAADVTFCWHWVNTERGHNALGVCNYSWVKITHSCSILKSQKTILEHKEGSKEAHLFTFLFTVTRNHSCSCFLNPYFMCKQLFFTGFLAFIL